jgi:hypothetical protein
MGVARWGLGDPPFPQTAYAQGGKYAYTDDQETPNTLLASYNYGPKELVFEVRGLLTGAEGGAVKRSTRAPAEGATAPSVSPTVTVPAKGEPLHIMVGNLFYGTEGWAAMSDQGFQAFKGESNELVADERPEKGPGSDATALHMQNFLAACRSRNYKELHDEIANAYLSASLCHLANISYRVGRKLTLTAGPKFANDPEADKMLTRDYRKPYVVA